MTGNDTHEPNRGTVPSSYLRQFITGASGESFSQAVTIVTQLVLVPALLLLWGQERLGIWLILSAVPTYLTLGDLGLTSIFGNEITARRLSGDSHGATIAVHSSWYTTRIITVCAMGLSVVLTLVAPSITPHVQGISEMEIRGAMLLLCLAVCVTLAQGTVGASMRVMGLAGVMSGVNALARLAENIALLAAALFSHSLALAALAMLVSRTLVLVVARGVFLHQNPAFKPATGLASRKLIWRLMPASAGYFSFTFGNAALIQLPTLIIGNLLSPTAVVVFTAARTLSRMGRMLVSIVNNAIDPIFTQLAGRNSDDLQRTTHMHRRGIFWFGALYLVVAGLVGPTVLSVWSHGVTIGHDTVYYFMLLASVLEIFWFTIQVPYISINQHYVFGWVYFALSLASAAGIFVLIPAFGLVGAAFCIAVSHGLFLIYTLFRVRSHPVRLEPTKI
jgi:O-antigen/teichoic acid export membrane protein